MIPLLVVLCLGRSELIEIGGTWYLDGGQWRPAPLRTERHTLRATYDNWCVPITEPYDYRGPEGWARLPGYWDADGRYLPIPDEGLIFVFDEEVCYVSRSGREYCSRFDADEPGFV